VEIPGTRSWGAVFETRHVEAVASRLGPHKLALRNCQFPHHSAAQAHLCDPSQPLFYSFTLFCIGQVRPLFPHHLHLLGQAIRISTRKGSMLADLQVRNNHDSKHIRCVGRRVSLSKRQWDYKSVFNSSTITTTNVNAALSHAGTSEFEGPQRIQFSMSDERVLQMAGSVTQSSEIYFCPSTAYCKTSNRPSNVVAPTMADDTGQPCGTFLTSSRGTGFARLV